MQKSIRNENTYFFLLIAYEELQFANSKIFSNFLYLGIFKVQTYIFSLKLAEKFKLLNALIVLNDCLKSTYRAFDKKAHSREIGCDY